LVRVNFSLSDEVKKTKPKWVGAEGEEKGNGGGLVVGLLT
jgi:hypothetical protein